MGKNDDIREHYNKIKKTPQERYNSVVANIRYSNNFIKAVLIKTYTKPNDLVLDIGCGKGGDLIKYNRARIREYYGLDIAELSIYDARVRHNNMNNCFRAYFDTFDVYNAPLYLNKEFNVLSSQFSLHYAFHSQESLNVTVGNINRHLKKGGFFIFTVPSKEEIVRRYRNGTLSNQFYKIRFETDIENAKEYYFSLKDCVNDCVEYFVDFDLLVSMFKKYDIRLVEREMFDSFYSHHLLKYPELAKNMRCKPLSKDENAVISLYEIVVFKKY